MGGVVQGTFTNGLLMRCQCINRYVPVVRISALRIYGTMNIGLRTMGKPKKIGSLIWKICVGSEMRLTFRNAGSRELNMISASAMVAPVPPTFTNVEKKPFAVMYGKGSPAVLASTLAARYCRKIGATTASIVLSPLMPTDHSIVTRKAYVRIPGSVFSANTSGLKAPCTTPLMSIPNTKRIVQKVSTRQNNGVRDTKDS